MRQFKAFENDIKPMYEIERLFSEGKISTTEKDEMVCAYNKEILNWKIDKEKSVQPKLVMEFPVNIKGYQWTFDLMEYEGDEEVSSRELCEENGFIQMNIKYFKTEKDFREKLRYRLIQAYLFSCGLSSNTFRVDSKSAWAMNEEMVDWFALQMPQIMKTENEIMEKIFG